MTTIHLVRHATNDTVGRSLAGRHPGTRLNEEGRRQSTLLAEALAATHPPITRIFSSPLERTQETAQPLGRRLGLVIQPAPEILEIDFGSWTGQTLTELDRDPLWHRWNKFRSAVRIPQGESMVEVQSRMIQFVEKTRTACAGETIALISHGDPIKAVLLYFLGIPLDLLPRLEISPASWSTLEFHDDSVRVIAVNRVAYKAA